MNRVIFLILVALFSFVLLNLNPEPGLSSSNEGKAVKEGKQKDVVFAEDVQFEDNTVFVQNKSKNPFAKPGQENAKSEVSDDLGTYVELKGFLYKSSDNKYFISSRQRMWIEAVDTAKDAPGVGVQKIEVKLNNDDDYYEYIGPKTKPFSIGMEGEYPITYIVTDKLNNKTEPEVFNVVIDNTPPKAEIEYLVTDPRTYYKKGHVAYVPKEHDISVFAVDTGSGVKDVKVSLNNGPYVGYKAGDTIRLRNEGLSTLRLRAVDNVLNETNDTIYNIYVDDTPPCISVTPKFALLPGDGQDVMPRPRTRVVPQPVIEDKGGADKQKPYEEIGCLSPKFQTVRPGSSTEEEFHKPRPAFDKDGRYLAEPPEDPVFNYKWWKDRRHQKNPYRFQEGDDGDCPCDCDKKTGKTGTTGGRVVEPNDNGSADEEGWCIGTKPNGKYTNTDNLFYLSAFDAESGLSHIEWKLDDGEYQRYIEPFKVQEPGRHMLYIRATDYVGNYRIVKLPLIVDDIAPSTDIKAEYSKEAVISDGSGEKVPGIEPEKAEIHPRNEE